MSHDRTHGSRAPKVATNCQQHKLTEWHHGDLEADDYGGGKRRHIKETYLVITIILWNSAPCGGVHSHLFLPSVVNFSNELHTVIIQEFELRILLLSYGFPSKTIVSSPFFFMICPIQIPFLLYVFCSLLLSPTHFSVMIASKRLE